MNNIEHQEIKNYFKPKSITWWSGVSSIGLGVSKIAGFQHDFIGIVGDILSQLAGGNDTSPAGLIVLGFGLIGIRAKMDRFSGNTQNNGSAYPAAVEKLEAEPSPAEIANYEAQETD